jgi:SAM-dependent methyltransferase
MKTTLTVVSFPVWVPLGGLYLAFQFLAPQSWRDKLFFGHLLPRGMDAANKAQRAKRQVLLQHVSGRVLDVGAGSGSYFCYYTQADAIVAVEPGETLHPHLRKAAARYLQHQKEPMVIVRDLVELDPAKYQFDWIILGNVLCEVLCQVEALQRVNQLLAPGGHVYFSEHMGCPKGTWQRRLQDAINPIWHRGTMGCNCNRDTLLHLQQQQQDGHWHQLAYWTVRNVTIGLGPLILGLAYKKPFQKQE